MPPSRRKQRMTAERGGASMAWRWEPAGAPSMPVIPAGTRWRSWAADKIRRNVAGCGRERFRR